MKFELTLGELITILVVIAQGFAFWITTERRITVLEERVQTLRDNHPVPFAKYSNGKGEKVIAE